MAAKHVNRGSGVRLVGAVGQVGAEQRHRVVRLLAGKAEDADDLRELLDAAGLNAIEGKGGGGNE